MMRGRASAFAVALSALALGGAARAEQPRSWILSGSAPQNYEMGVEGADKVPFIRGKPAASTAGGFGTLMQYIDARPYLGRRVRLSASLKTEAAAQAQMWMRVEAAEAVVAFDNMNDRPVAGTTGWRRYEIVLDVPADAAHIAYGFFLIGAGKVAADDFRIETVGRDTPTTGAPWPPIAVPVKRPSTWGIAPRTARPCFVKPPVERPERCAQ